MDSDLRMALWNVMLDSVWKFGNYHLIDGALWQMLLVKRVWKDELRRPLDELPTTREWLVEAFKEWWFRAEWFKVYDVVNLYVEHIGTVGNPFAELRVFREELDRVLEREGSGYRVVGNQLVEISNEEEIREIEEALGNERAGEGARMHLQQAVVLLAQKPEPDYRNSVKESISAVEAMARAVTENPKASLKEALKVVEERAELHVGLRVGLEKLYGYTSDEKGVRHGALELAEIDHATAKFMLVACSAFVNYLVEKTGTSSDGAGPAGPREAGGPGQAT